MVATSTAETAAWVARRGPPPTSRAAAIARATTSAIWAAPVPMTYTRASATRIPTATPTETSTARRPRWPTESPSAITADTGAKKGRECISTCLAISHAPAAASAVWRMGRAERAKRSRRSSIEVRERSVASRRSSWPLAASASRRSLRSAPGTAATLAGVRRTTRRGFLRNAAIAAATLHARPSLAAQPATRPEKLISLGGPTALSPGSVHDYRYWGNGADVLATGTRWVKLWVSWTQLQGPSPRPSTMAESWAQLGAGVPGTDGLGLRVLDEQVAAASADGVKVVLCLQHDAPEWARRLPGDPQLLAPPRRNVAQRLPRETGPESPFGWFVAHMCARYRRDAAANLSGPRVPGPGELALPGIDPGSGNPSGAVADAIEIGNEPNLMAWPLNEAPRIAAEMLVTADKWSARLRGPAILGPATSDTNGATGLRVDYLDFTRA